MGVPKKLQQIHVIAQKLGKLLPSQGMVKQEFSSEEHFEVKKDCDRYEKA